MARLLSGRTLPVQGPLLPRRSSRPELRVTLPRGVSLPALVVRRVGGSARRRPTADN